MEINKINFIGSWILIESNKPNVANFLKALNISYYHVIDNDNNVTRLTRRHGKYFLEGGYIYLKDDQLIRIGKSPNSYQIYRRDDSSITMIKE